MSLYIHQVATVVVGGSVPEVHEAGVIERGGRLETGDVSAQLAGFLVGAQHHGSSVPAHQRTNAMLDRLIAGMRCLPLGRNCVQIRRVGRVGDCGTAATGLTDDLLEDELSAVCTLEFELA